MEECKRMSGDKRCLSKCQKGSCPRQRGEEVFSKYGGRDECVRLAGK